LKLGFEAFVRGIGGELGAFLTPREVVEFMVGLADPRVGEAVLDPACGAGYFLIWSLLHQLGKGGAVGGGGRVGECLWGIDIDPFLARLCRINLKLFGADGRIFRADSLDLIDDPVMEGHGAARSALREVLDGGGFDVILTNPPFGRRRGALVTDRRVLEKYENGRGRRAQAPEILFVELCIRLLRPGGRAAILVPDGILSNMGRDYVALRRYVLRECLLRAVVSLPAGTFKQYGTDVKTSVLLQRKRSPEETQEYVFMAIARHIGYDTHAERYRKEPQNDLPTLLNKYREWSNKQGGDKPDP
jgi:type I restriction enzyme M protein